MRAKWKLYWRSLTLEQRNSIAELSDCSIWHLRNIGFDGKRASPTLAIKIEHACGYPKEMLRPDIFGEYES